MLYFFKLKKQNNSKFSNLVDSWIAIYILILTVSLKRLNIWHKSWVENAFNLKFILRETFFLSESVRKDKLS